MNDTNRDLLERIKRGENDAFMHVYRAYYHDFLAWARKYFSYDTDDVKEVFQASVIVLYENAKRGHLENLEASLKTYLFAVGKNKIREHMRRTGRMNDILSMPDLPEELDEERFTSEQFAVAKDALVALGEPCRQLLTLYYFENKSMEEIASIMSYSNALTAKNQKYKCLLRLRNIFTEKSKLSTL